jgi:hypothetical protein
LKAKVEHFADEYELVSEKLPVHSPALLNASENGML